MGGRALFFSVMLAVAPAMAVDGATDSGDAILEEPATWSWIPRSAPTPRWLADGEASGFVGQRIIDGDAWRNLPPVFQVGAQVTLGSRQWWVRPVVGYYHAAGSGDYKSPGEFDLSFGNLGSLREAEARGQLTVAIDEVDLGVGRGWSWSWFHLEGATGAGWVRARLEDRPATTIFRLLAKADLSPRYDQAETIAWWSSIGLNGNLGEARLGLAARYTYAPMTLSNRSFEAGGFQLGGTVGWMW